ncbi:MAG: 50S ribosomal protein L4 [bacterium]
MDVVSVGGTVKSDVILPDRVFRYSGSDSLVWEAVRVYLANQRAGTAKTKTRAEVSGTGKKPYRQKHTGNARHGSRRSPIFRGGGIAFGPLPRDYGLGFPKQKRRAALFAALSARNAEGAIRVVEDFSLTEPKTKLMAQAVAGFGFEGSLLLLPAEVSKDMLRAGRNIPGLTLMPARMLHPYAVLKHDVVAFTVAGLESFLKLVGAA